ncbi:hypothetical protein H6P81_002366 [Aristolochia fimbriata]|uniref:RNase H type-1 domain-containing protein n=1 Tax=Aristolochia fimbriata TaxID=158543 RepID=A0AAV7FA94_ARIFI|nr:hypothetical protein H6P81_002366 [Aristolochia fimbriata]
MSSLHPKVVAHKLAVHPSVRLVKQTQRRFRPELISEIEKEVDKLIAANFIWEACPKVDFPLLIIELMVDATTGHKVLSFIDGSSSYNQIHMNMKDEELTAFRMPKGIFCYKVHQRSSLDKLPSRSPCTRRMELPEEFPDEEIFLVEILLPWKMYFDGAAKRNGVGARILFVLPKDDLLSYSFVLSQNCSNNVAEYQTLLLGLGMAVEMEIPQLKVYGDSVLMIKQITREFEVKKSELVPFWKHVGNLLAKIPEASLHYILHTWNGPADALAKIITSLAHVDNRPSQVPICERWVVPLVPLPIEEEAEGVMEEREESLPISICENEATDWFAPPMLAQRRRTTSAKRDACGYLWCGSSQIEATHATSGAGPLDGCVLADRSMGMDIIGPITPKSNYRQYILAATDYFSKWAEDTTFREVKAITVADFIRTIYLPVWRPSVHHDEQRDAFPKLSHGLVLRKVSQTTKDVLNLQPSGKRTCKGIQQNTLQILKKTVDNHKHNWDEKLGEALWAYRTTLRTPTQSTLIGVRHRSSPAVRSSASLTLCRHERRSYRGDATRRTRVTR